MAKYKDSVCRLCRRERQKLFLKGDRCYTDKCSVSRRTYAPGQHGQNRKKLSEYGIQLREKQKAKRYYGILEKQFRKYFDMAAKSRGITGEKLLQILETRMDNVIYRMGFGSSRAQARQLVNHGHFKINGTKVNIPSHLVKVNDVIEPTEKGKQIEVIKENMEDAASKAVPQWIEMDTENMVGKITSLPTREDIDLPVSEQLIVELYSR